MRLFFLALAIGLSWLPPDIGMAQDAEISGEILKISKKRTVILLDLAGDADVSEGSKIQWTAGGKIRTGIVRSVAKNGKAMIKLNKGLPAAVAKGDTVSLVVLSGDTPSAASNAPVRLAKGYRNKAYWDDVSYLASHRRSGTRTDVEVGYLGKQGARESSGGAESSDIEYKYQEKTTAVNGGAGYVGRGGIGGGFLFDYISASRETSASVDTESTASVDSLSDKFDRKVTNIAPYLALLSRAKTGDFGFGAGLGFLMRNTTSDYVMEDGADTIDPKATKVTQTGVTLEFLMGSNSWAFITQINPGIKGKEKQDGFDDVERTSSEFGFHFETYGDQLKSRIGVIYYVDKGESDIISQKDSGYKISGRLDSDLRTFHLVPFLDYASIKRKVDQAEGTQTVTDIGTRVAWSGVYAPFVSLGLSILNEKQSGNNIPDVKTTAGGLKIAGGISI